MAHRYRPSVFLTTASRAKSAKVSTLPRANRILVWCSCGRRHRALLYQLLFSLRHMYTRLAQAVAGDVENYKKV